MQDDGIGDPTLGFEFKAEGTEQESVEILQFEAMMGIPFGVSVYKLLEERQLWDRWRGQSPQVSTSVPNGPSEDSDQYMSSWVHSRLQKEDGEERVKSCLGKREREKKKGSESNQDARHAVHTWARRREPLERDGRILGESWQKETESGCHDDVMVPDVIEQKMEMVP